MPSREDISSRLEFHKSMLAKLQAAALALAEGGVQSYTIDDRSLTKFNLPALNEEIAREERTVDQLAAQLAGRKARAAFGVVPRNW